MHLDPLQTLERRDKACCCSPRPDKEKNQHPCELPDHVVIALLRREALLVMVRVHTLKIHHLMDKEHVRHLQAKQSQVCPIRCMLTSCPGHNYKALPALSTSELNHLFLCGSPLALHNFTSAEHNDTVHNLTASQVGMCQQFPNCFQFMLLNYQQYLWFSIGHAGPDSQTKLSVSMRLLSMLVIHIVMCRVSLSSSAGMQH